MAMQSQAMMGSGTTDSQTLTFDRFAGASSMLAGAAGLLYAISFIVLRNTLLSAVWLLLGGLFLGPVLIALYKRVRHVDEQFACLAVFLAGGGLLGSLIHGGYDLATAIHPPAINPLNAANLPNAVDPRGLLTFGVAGLGIFASAWLMQRSRRFPRGLAIVGYVLGILLLGLYLGRLIVLDATSPVILVPALLTGFLLNPLWNIWLGFVLARPRSNELPTVREPMHM